MRLSRPIYESLPVLYALAGVLLLGVSYRLHTGSISVLLMIAGVLCLIGGAAVWLRRRDFRAVDAQYELRSNDRPGNDLSGNGSSGNSGSGKDDSGLS